MMAPRIRVALPWGWQRGVRMGGNCYPKRRKSLETVGKDSIHLKNDNKGEELKTASALFPPE